jgi:hypothetical protein
MGMMFAFHDALRRELGRIGRISARADDDPRRVLRTAVGWQMFKDYLRVHHTSEDDAVWGVLLPVLADRPGDIALLDAMEAEHAAIDPLLNAIDAAIVDLDDGPERVGGLVDELNTKLTAHLRHEESEGLALIDSALTEQQWQHFADVHRDRIGSDAPRYLPWLLDSATEEGIATALARLPEFGRVAYRDSWLAAYQAHDIWAPE